MDFSYVHIRYSIGYVYHICLLDTIRSTLLLCLPCQAMLLPMPLRPLLLSLQSGFTSRQIIHIGTREGNVEGGEVRVVIVRGLKEVSEGAGLL